MRKLFPVLLLAAGIAAAQDFTFVLVPDIQVLSESYPSVLMTEFNWIVTHQLPWNIRGVIGLGDNVNTAIPDEFRNATGAWNTVRASNIPFVISIGNHDYDQSNPYTRATTLWDGAFPPSYYAGLPWETGFGSFNNSTANQWVRFNVERQPWVFLSLEFFPRPAALDWAQAVIKANSDARIIISTHAYLTNIGGVHPVLWGDQWGPTQYGLTAASGSAGQDMWAKLVADNQNVVAMVNGHFILGPACHSSQVTRNSFGSNVITMYSDYQTTVNGWLTLLHFRPAQNIIEVYNYSPDQDLYDPAAPMYTLPFGDDLPARSNKPRSLAK